MYTLNHASSLILSEGPQPAVLKHENCCKYLCRVSYMPKIEGVYKINILLHEKHVADSPFLVHVEKKRRYFRIGPFIYSLNHGRCFHGSLKPGKTLMFKRVQSYSQTCALRRGLPPPLSHKFLTIPSPKA